MNQKVATGRISIDCGEKYWVKNEGKTVLVILLFSFPVTTFNLLIYTPVETWWFRQSYFKAPEILILSIKDKKSWVYSKGCLSLFYWLTLNWSCHKAHLLAFCTAVITLFFIHLTRNEPSPSIRHTDVLKGKIARPVIVLNINGTYILPHTICSDFPDNNIHMFWHIRRYCEKILL